MPRWEWDRAKLLPAERRVVEALRNGDWDDEGFINVGEGEGGGALPEAGDESRKLSAEVVKALALGRAPGVELPDTGLLLSGGWIAGRLSLEGATAERDLGLVACCFDAAPVLRSAWLRGLFLNRSELPGLDADGLNATGSIVLRGATVYGEARLLGARIGGNLDCDDATFEREGGYALTADRLDASGGVLLGGARVRGEARLLGVRIGGDLDCVGARFEREGGVALNADGLDASGAVILRGATVRGEVRLLGAKIGGSLQCSEASLSNQNARALTLSGAAIEERLILSETRILGETRLLDTHIGSDFNCRNTSFDVEGGDALIADRLSINGNLWFQNTTVRGTTHLVSSKTSGDLVCTGSSFERPGSKAMKLNDAVVEGSLVLRCESRFRGALDLTAANLGTVDDDEESWPGPSDLLLNLCRYGQFKGNPTDSAARLRWLALQDASRWGQEFWTQPYEQVATVFRGMGRDEDARTVQNQLERLRRRQRRSRLGPLSRRLAFAADTLFGLVLDYGRQPLRAGIWLVGFLLVGTAVFDVAGREAAMKPNNPFVLRAPEWTGCSLVAEPRVYATLAEERARPRAAPGEAQKSCFERQHEARAFPAFNPFIYSADTLLPIVDLEMQDHWIPDDSKGPVGRWARYYLWLHIALGWALSLLAVAGFSGLVKSD